LILYCTYLAVYYTTIAACEACFDANKEISVSTTIVADNASANFISGYSVDFFSGFHVVEGSYIHVLITETHEPSDFTFLLLTYKM
jgi:hypothetical protein